MSFERLCLETSCQKLTVLFLSTSFAASCQRSFGKCGTKLVAYKSFHMLETTNRSFKQEVVDKPGQTLNSENGRMEANLIVERNNPKKIHQKHEKLSLRFLPKRGNSTLRVGASSSMNTLGLFSWMHRIPWNKTDARLSSEPCWMPALLYTTMDKQLSVKICSLDQAHSSAHARSALPNAPRLEELCRIPHSHRQFSWLKSGNANAQKVMRGIQTFSFSIFFFNVLVLMPIWNRNRPCFEKCMEPKLKFPFNGSPSPPHLQWKTFNHTSWSGYCSKKGIRAALPN